MTVDDLRRQLTDEYGQERFTMTVGEIEQRAGRRPRRFAAWVAATAAAAVTVGFLVWPHDRAREAPPLVTPIASAAPAWQASFAEDCRRKWQDFDRSRLPEQERAELPPPRIERVEGELGIRVYGNDRVIATCQRSHSGSLGIGVTYAGMTGRAVLPDVGAGIQRFGSISHLDATPSDTPTADFYVGRVPAGTVRMDAVGVRGEVVDAVLDGDLFLLWTTVAGLDGAVSRAYTRDTVLMDTGPIYLRDEDKGQSADRLCRWAADAFTTRAGAPPLPPRRFAFGGGDDALMLYAAPGAVVACRPAAGQVQVVSISRLPGAEEWQPLRHVYELGLGSGWVLGLAPAGARSGTMTLPGGRKVPLQLAGGWFAARWTGKAGVWEQAPAKVQITTADEVWTEQGGQVTRRPR
ncbi:hypothetical protein [Catellatospora methionotrophica]|uniref:hypothetical protein n=1 Tax=Catellatospora methionotrophica TaxID=121620 RepID=UPI0033C29216